MTQQQQSKFTHHFTTAGDGAFLSYYSVRPDTLSARSSPKPTVLILHGAATYALSHAEFAIALSPFYTVHTASRRGRGRSDNYPDNVIDLYKPRTASSGTEKTPTKDATVYPPAFSAAVLATDVADLTTLITTTQAQYVIGVSSGALVALEHLQCLAKGDIPTLPTYKKLILFEPPLFFKQAPSPEAFDTTAVRDFERALAANDIAGAAVEAVRAVRLGPTWMLPRWLMRMLCGMMFRAQEKKERAEEAAAATKREESEKGDEDMNGKGVHAKLEMIVQSEKGENAARGVSSMAALMPMIRYDFAVAEHMKGEAHRFFASRKAGVDVLCLRGSKSPAYLKEAVRELASVMPHGRKDEIEGVGHEVMCGPEMRGRPAKAVPAVRQFFDAVEDGHLRVEVSSGISS